MPKLTLDPEALRVESLAAAPEAADPEIGLVDDFTRPHVCDPVTAWC